MSSLLWGQVVRKERGELEMDEKKEPWSHANL